MRLYADLVSGTASAVSKTEGVVTASAVSRAADVLRILLRKDDMKR